METVNVTAALTFAVGVCSRHERTDSPPRRGCRRAPGEAVTSVYRTFAQVLPGFPSEFQLSFPQVRAVQLLAGGSEHVRLGPVSPRLFPALLWVFANREAQSLGVSRTDRPQGRRGQRDTDPQGEPARATLANSTVVRLVPRSDRSEG